MGLFGFGSKREGVVDLAERYRLKKDREASEEAEKKSSSGLSLFSPAEDAKEQEGSDFSDTDTAEERKRKLAKRLIDIINRLDDLSNKIYHLQQRIELLERKADIGRAES